MSCVTCSRGFVGILNLLMLLVAAAVIGLACWIRWDNNFEYALRNAIQLKNNIEPLGEIKEEMRTWITVSYWVIMGFAIACFILGFFGMIGSCIKSRCILILYFICMIILIALEIAVGIFVIVKHGAVKNEVNSYVNYSYVVQSQQDIQAITDRYSCCGVDGQATLGCSPGQKTCTNAVWERLDLTLVIFGFSMLGVVILQIITTIVTLPIFTSRKREETTF